MPWTRPFDAGWSAVVIDAVVPSDLVSVLPLTVTDLTVAHLHLAVGSKRGDVEHTVGDVGVHEVSGNHRVGECLGRDRTVGWREHRHAVALDLCSACRRA